MRSKTEATAPFQSISSAARLTGLSAGFIRAGCKAGMLPHVRVGADYRVNVPKLLALLDELSTANAKGERQ